MSDKETLALHVCCGPCATVCLERLTPRFRVVPVWFNPNIYPDEEHERRFAAAEEVCAAFGLGLFRRDMPHESWLNVQAAREEDPEGGTRCQICIVTRLFGSVEVAAAADCDLFTTTLTVGPQKDVEYIHEVGRKFAEGFGLRWLEETFRKGEGFKRSVELSEELGLYRQHYCGCEFSLRDT